MVDPPVRTVESANCFTNPMKTCWLAGPNSVKYGGSSALTQASIPGVPSIVWVWIQPSPSGGTMKMVYLPG